MFAIIDSPCAKLFAFGLSLLLLRCVFVIQFMSKCFWKRNSFPTEFDGNKQTNLTKEMLGSYSHTGLKHTKNNDTSNRTNLTMELFGSC